MANRERDVRAVVVVSPEYPSCSSGFGVHFRFALIRAFAISMRFRMTATIATLAGFPAARRRWYFCFRSGLQRNATNAGMYRASRKGLRPLPMNDFSCHCPDWRVIGARPARLATCLRSSVPSSGIRVSIAAAETAPTPGMERKISHVRAVFSCAAINVAISTSSSAI